MPTYLVTYDLRQPGRNYTELYEAIKEVGTSWCHPVESTWFVVSGKTATTIRDLLATTIDANDRLIVATVSAPGAWRGLGTQAGEWLMTNL